MEANEDDLQTGTISVLLPGFSTYHPDIAVSSIASGDHYAQLLPIPVSRSYSKARVFQCGDDVF